MKIAFLLSYSSNPRLNKRIGLLKKRHDLHLIYWNRETKDMCKLYHTDINNIEIKATLSVKSRLNRALSMIPFMYKAISALNTIQPDCIYAANIDMLFVCELYRLFQKKVKIIYEIGDLRKEIIDDQNRFYKKIFKLLITKIEKKLCENINILVVTSEKFYDIYYYKFIKQDKLLVIPNMPELEAFKSYNKKENGTFTIGFIGAVRYEEQMKMLISAADKCDVNILFAGYSYNDEIEFLCKNKSNVEYYGKYDYNTEIAKLYSKCDCIYSVYDADINNVKIALPNKLYESIYCEIPIIVARGTYLAELVENMGVGVSVSHKDEEELISAIKSLSQNQLIYKTLVKNCRRFKEDINLNKYNEILLKKIDDLERNLT